MSQILPAPRTRALGKSGIEVSAMAWGMWRFAGRPVAEAHVLVDAAFASGITLFDTADVYGCDTSDGFGAAEALLGQVLARDKSARDRMVLATKGGIVLGVPYDQSPDYLEAAVDASLRRLHTDTIDLWQVHRPDILAHPHETAMTMERLHARGKIRAFGVSNFTPAQTLAMQAFASDTSLPLSTVQPEISPLQLGALTDGTLDLAMQFGLAPLAWSPLGGGRISGPANAREQAVADALDVVADLHGVSRTAASYAWIMAHPARPIPIIGSQNADRIREALDAYKVQWTRTQWYAVLVASREEQLP